MMIVEAGTVNYNIGKKTFVYVFFSEKKITECLEPVTNVQDCSCNSNQLLTTQSLRLQLKIT